MLQHARRVAARVAAPAVRSLRSTAPKPAIYENVLETIGNTPVVKCGNIAPKGRPSKHRRRPAPR